MDAQGGASQPGPPKKSGAPQGWVNWFKFNADNQFGLYTNLISLVIGIVLQKFLDAKWTHGVLVGATSYSLMIVVLFVCSHRRSRRVEDELTRTSTECAKLQSDLQALADKFRVPSEHFESLAGAVQHFSVYLLALGSLMIGTMRDSSEARRLLTLRKTRLDSTARDFRRAHSELIRSICDTAVAVIDSSRAPFKHGSSASIIVLTGRNDRYLPLLRCGRVSDVRRKDDERLRKDPILVEKHLMYHWICGHYVSEQRCFYHVPNRVPDMDAFLKELEDTGLRGQFSEPRRDASTLFQSCLIVPIMHLKDKRQLLGFLCIDTLEKGAYDEEYDLRILTELAHFASVAIGAYNTFKRYAKPYEPTNQVAPRGGRTRV